MGLVWDIRVGNKTKIKQIQYIYNLLIILTSTAKLNFREKYILTPIAKLNYRENKKFRGKAPTAKISHISHAKYS